MKSVIAVVALLACLAGDAAAGMVAQCVDDASRFCSNVKQKQLYACLRKHASQLSFGCADVMGQGTAPSGEVCQNDALRLCNSRKLNKGARRCLERNFDRLTPDCQTYFYRQGWIR